MFCSCPAGDRKVIPFLREMSAKLTKGLPTC